MYASTSRDHALNDIPTGCDLRNYLNPVTYGNSRQRKQTQFFFLQLKVLMLAVTDAGVNQKNCGGYEKHNNQRNKQWENCVTVW